MTTKCDPIFKMLQKKERKKKEKFKKKERKSKKQKKKKSLFSVVLDKMCVFCLYPIPDSQQRVKRDSCRRLILSRLLCLFSFWTLGPFVSRFEFGSRTYSVYVYLFYRVFESLSRLIVICAYFSYLIMFRIVFRYHVFVRVLVCLIVFRVIFRFVSNCYLCTKFHFVKMSCCFVSRHAFVFAYVECVS